MEKFKLTKFRIIAHYSDGPVEALADSENIREFNVREDAKAYAQAWVTAWHSPSEPPITTYCEVIEVEKKLRPVGNNVVLRVLEQPSMSKGGLHLPTESMRGRADRGEILAVGADVQQADAVLGDTWVRAADRSAGALASPRPGQVVRFNPYAVKLAIGPQGADMTRNALALPGMLAIISADELQYVEVL